MTDQKVALVTGASKGIGAAVARRLGRDGFAVVVNYVGSKDEADAVVRDIESAGGRAVSARADVGAPDGLPSLFDAAETAFGGLDVLVNNAGVMLKLVPVAETEDAAFETTMALNVGGVFRGMREGAKRLREGGRIISFSTSVVGFNLPGYGIYAASKAAVETLTRILAKELGSRKITVNVVAPGPVDTALFTTGKTEEQIAAVTKMIPLGRLGQPDDIAGVVSFLAGADSGWVNGQVIRANGGAV